MADAIAVMNLGRIEQTGTADGALRAPAHGVRRELPRDLEPPRRPRRPPRRRDGDVRDRRPAPRCTSPPTASPPPATTAVRVGVRPEKLRLAAAETAAAAGNVLRGHVTDASYLGVIDAVRRPRRAGRT